MDTSGLCVIRMDGEEITLKFGIPACRLYLDKVTQDHVNPLSGGSVNEVGVAWLLYAGYYNYCVINEVVPKKKFADFMGWIESHLGEALLKDEMQRVADCYKNSSTVNKYLDIAEKEVEDLKKKTRQLTGTSSNRSATGNSASRRQNSGRRRSGNSS